MKENVLLGVTEVVSDSAVKKEVRIRRSKTIGFSGLYIQPAGSEDAPSLIATATNRSGKSCRSVTTSVMGDDLEYYRGRLSQKREELIASLVHEDGENSVCFSVGYYTLKSKFYGDLYDKIRDVCDSLVQELKALSSLEKEAEGYSKLTPWKVGPKVVSNQKKKNDELVKKLNQFLQAKQNFKEEAIQFSEAVQEFLRNSSEVEDLESLDAKEVLKQIKKMNQIIDEVNQAIKSVANPFKDCTEKEKWIWREIERMKSKGIDVILKGSLFEWFDDKKVSDLPIFMPISIEATAADAGEDE